MNVMTKTRFEVVPLTRHIGAELRGIDLRQKPDEETVKAIYQAWLDHLVIVFPGSSSPRRISSALPAILASKECRAGRRNSFPRATPRFCRASC